MTNEVEQELIRLNKVRLSFPTLVTPKAFAAGQDEKYSADFIFPADHPDMKKFKEEGIKLAMAKWGDEAGPIIEMIKQTKKLRCFGKGSERINMKTGKVYDGYNEEGAEYLSANSSDKPDLYGADGQKLMNATRLYGGCFVNAYVKPWIQNNKYGKAIRCDLVAIQFDSDGESFGAQRPDTEGLFQRVAGAPDVQDETAANAAAGSYEF